MHHASRANQTQIGRRVFRFPCVAIQRAAIYFLNFRNWKLAEISHRVRYRSAFARVRIRAFARSFAHVWVLTSLCTRSVRETVILDPGDPMGIFVSYFLVFFEKKEKKNKLTCRKQNFMITSSLERDGYFNVAVHNPSQEILLPRYGK